MISVVPQLALWPPSLVPANLRHAQRDEREAERERAENAQRVALLRPVLLQVLSNLRRCGVLATVGAVSRRTTYDTDPTSPWISRTGWYASVVRLTPACDLALLAEFVEQASPAQRSNLHSRIVGCAAAHGLRVALNDEGSRYTVLLAVGGAR